ncbi:MAG: hypothetical protein OZ924_17785 [Burkholderiaceae bacterium]|jgi:hypothetical protein|nr:hypothetical protein [Burkholderiaceae bacterium]
MSDELTPDSPPEALRAAAERNRKQVAALLVANLAHGRLVEASAAQVLVQAAQALLEAQRYATEPGDVETLQEALAGASAVRVTVELPRTSTGIRPTVSLVAIDGYGGEVPIMQGTAQPVTSN